MTEARRREVAQRTRFCITNPGLDLAGLKIVWANDRSLWKGYVEELDERFQSLEAWDSKQVETILDSVYLERREEMLVAKDRFARWWGDCERSWLSLLSNVFELNQLQDDSFKAEIGIAPIFPRNIEQRSFLVPLRGSKKKIIRVCAHEISHFFFYQKFEKLEHSLQKEDKKVWVVSELLVPLLFKDSRAQSILGSMPQETYICKKSVISRAWDIYQQRVKGKYNGRELIEALLAMEIKSEELNSQFFPD